MAAAGCRDRRCSGFQERPLFTERPKLFDGRLWVSVLREQYGNDLRGLTLAELAQLPEVGWVQPPHKKGIRQRLGRQAVLHPGEEGFRFDQCPDFFDGEAYLTALVAEFGEGLEDLPPEAISRLPILTRTDPQQTYPRQLTAAQVVDAQRGSHQFLRQTRIDFEE